MAQHPRAKCSNQAAAPQLPASPSHFRRTPRPAANEVTERTTAYDREPKTTKDAVTSLQPSEADDWADVFKRGDASSTARC